MTELTVAEKGWHVMCQIQNLADYERIPWYLPDVNALGVYALSNDEYPEFIKEPEVIAVVNDLLDKDRLCVASMQWWEEKDCLRFKVARRLFYLDDWATEGSLVRTVALNKVLQGKIAEAQTYLLGAADATGKRCFSDARRVIQELVES